MILHLPRLAAVLLLAALLLSPSAIVTGQSGDDRAENRRRDVGEGRASGDGEDRSGRGGGDADRIGVGRGFQSAGGGGNTLAGDFVAFSYTPSGIQNYTVGGTRYFDLSIASGEAGDDAPDARARGVEIRLDTDNYQLKAHDNRRGTLRIQTEGELSLDFPATASLTPRGRGFLISLAEGDRAFVFSHSDDPVTATGNTLTTGSDVHFHVLQGEGALGLQREMVSEATAAKRVGAEVRLDRRGADVLRDVVSYGNVSVDTFVSPGNVTLVVSGHGQEGRILVVDVRPELVGAATPDELNVLFDNESIRPADHLADALDPDDDGLHPEYHLVQDEDGFHFIVSVPHYSVHTLSILGLVEEVPPSVVVGVLFGVVMVASGGWVLFRPRRSK